MEGGETHPMEHDSARDTVRAFYGLHPYPPPVEA
jgi:hypothetical protein